VVNGFNLGANPDGAAALGIAMPVGRMTLSEMEAQWAATVIEFADKISAALGYQQQR